MTVAVSRARTNRSLTVAALCNTNARNRAATVRERLVVIPYRNSKQEYSGIFLGYFIFLLFFFFGRPNPFGRRGGLLQGSFI
jgi:hypothetical protein